MTAPELPEGMVPETLPAQLGAVLAIAHKDRAAIAAELGISRDAVRVYLSDLTRRGLWSADGGEARLPLTLHPLAELFPPMDEAGIDALVADLSRHGLRQKIVLDGQAILDGRNRYRALLQLGLIGDPVKVSDLTRYFRPLRPEEGEPLAFVLSQNLARRHLTEAQRALVAARLATMGRGRPEKQDSAGDEKSANLRNSGPEMTTAAAADALHVSPRSIETARVVLAQGAAPLVAAVERGEVSLHAAEAVASQPAAAQAELVARGKAEIMKAAKQFRAEEQALKAARRAEKEQALAARIAGSDAVLDAAGAAGKRYGVILADPEWRFEPYSRETGMDRAPENHYPTSPLAVIKARPVASIAAEDCVLFLWGTAPMLPQALEVMAAWDFAYKTHAVWDKGRCGTGYWLRSRHELLLIGTRGDVPAPAMGSQWASILDDPAGAHSAKPETAYRLIEEYFPNLPKIELNARSARPGWDVWGAEAPEEDCHV